MPYSSDFSGMYGPDMGLYIISVVSYVYLPTNPESLLILSYAQTLQEIAIIVISGYNRNDKFLGYFEETAQCSLK